jgi:hypothetical protein
MRRVGDEDDVRHDREDEISDREARNEWYA